MCGNLTFDNQDAKRKLVILAENEQLKRQRTTEQKKRTVARKRATAEKNRLRRGSLW
jgi:hypothetical protein